MRNNHNNGHSENSNMLTKKIEPHNLGVAVVYVFVALSILAMFIWGRT